MTPALVQLVAFVRKEARQTLRDRPTMFFVLVLPVLEVMLFTYAGNMAVDRVPTVIVDQDRSPESREELRRLLADHTLLEVARLDDEPRAERFLETGRAAAIVVFPPRFGRSLVRGERATFDLVLDGTDPNRSGVALGAIHEYLEAETARRLVDRFGARAMGLAVTTRPRIYYNPRLVTALYLVPGIAALLLVTITLLTAAMGMAREQESGTLEQVRVTPIPSSVVITAKMLPFVPIGLLDFVFALVAGMYLFDVPVRGNFGLLLLATLLFLVSTLGLGLLIAAESPTQQRAFMGGVIAMLPTQLLSGVFAPLSAMPWWLQRATLLNPVRYYVDVLRRCMLKGATLADVGPELGFLALLGTLVMGLAILRFRRALEPQD